MKKKLIVLMTDDMKEKPLINIGGGIIEKKTI